MRKLTIYLDDTSMRRVRRLAKRRQCAQSQIVREAVADYLSRERPPAKGIGAYDSGRTDVSERAEELLRGAARAKVGSPLIRSSYPGHRNLTNAEVGKILS
jgi:predicted transcriptional regulator